MKNMMNTTTDYEDDVNMVVRTRWYPTKEALTAFCAREVEMCVRMRTVGYDEMVEDNKGRRRVRHVARLRSETLFSGRTWDLATAEIEKQASVS